MKQPSNIDLSVLLIFFNRDDHFARVFAEVKRARPSRLFLYQDGARHERDLEGILRCRAICSDEQIDWQCQVNRLYQERNYGCDPSEFIAQKWAFSMTDKCVVLEDDDVPSQSFFPFCRELLLRYEHNPRVWMIAGFNPEHVQPAQPADYMFTSVFSIWGWASWRRVIDTWDADYRWMDNPQLVSKVENTIREKGLRRDFMQMCRHHRAKGIAFYETIFWSSMLLNDGVAILPVKNLINNIGAEGASTHFQGSLATMPRRLRQQFTMPRHELQFPLRHPAEKVETPELKEAVYRRNAWGHPLIKIAYSIEELLLNLRHGNFRIIFRALLNRLRILTGLRRHH